MHKMYSIYTVSCHSLVPLQHLTEALIGMEKVAEHINEMQRIHEEYGAIFDHLFRQHQKASKQVRANGASPRLAGGKGVLQGSRRTTRAIC